MSIASVFACCTCHFYSFWKVTVAKIDRDIKVKELKAPARRTTLAFGQFTWLFSFRSIFAFAWATVLTCYLLPRSTDYRGWQSLRSSNRWNRSALWNTFKICLLGRRTEGRWVHKKQGLNIINVEIASQALLILAGLVAAYWPDETRCSNDWKRQRNYTQIHNNDITIT